VDVPEKLTEMLPRATQEEHVTANILKYNGSVERESEIRVRNRTQAARFFELQVGTRKVVRGRGAKEAILEVEPGLLAITITIQKDRYVTQSLK